MQHKNLLPLLPPPPEGKHGWPWTTESDIKAYDSNKQYPKISIVTPSYNQAQFIEETIRSILLQNYPNLEFIIIDGGSNDGTVEILKKYDTWITYWVSEKDKGQSHALNKGFEQATGDLVGWQNSDDIYLPDTFAKVANFYHKNHSKYDIFYGKINHIDEQSNLIKHLYLVPFSFFVLKYYDINICNQGIFFKNEIVKHHKISETNRFAMDAEYYFRLSSLGYRFGFVNHWAGGFRIQADSKTATILDVSLAETRQLRRDYGVPVIDNIPWAKQFPVQKIVSQIYILFYRIIYGGAFESIQKKIFYAK